MDINIVRHQLEEVKTVTGACMMKTDDNITELKQLRTSIQEATDKKEPISEQVTRFQLLVADSKKQIYKSKWSIANAKLASLDFQKSKGRTWITKVINVVFHLEIIASIYSWIVRYWRKTELREAKKEVNVEEIESVVNEKKMKINAIVKQLVSQGIDVNFKRKRF